MAAIGPFRRLTPDTRRRLAIAAVAIAAVLFPILHPNDADIDSAANALAFAALALGLNIVVGFAGLLDLGYAAFFAIGAYSYGIAASWQVQPEWSGFWQPLQWLDLVSRFHTASGDVVHFNVSFWLMLPVSAAIAAFFGVLFGAPTLRLKGDYLAIVTLGFGEIVPIVARNAPALTNGAHGPERGRRSAILRLRFRRRRDTLLLCRASYCRFPDPDQLAAQGFRASAAPGWRSARTRSPPRRWASTGRASSSWLLRSVRPLPAPPAPSMSPNCRPPHRKCSCFRFR